MLKRIILFATVVSGNCFPSEPSLPSVFSDHMVLQRDRPVPVWGKADPNTTVTVQFAGQTKTAVADPDGKWRVDLDPLPASATPSTLTILDQVSGFKFQVSDVLVGEVWFCSGQSNMQMPMKGWPPKCPLDNTASEIAAADHPGIRLYNAPMKFSAVPEESIDAHWNVCTPETAASFSACAYYFGRKLHQDLGVPVGLLLSSWGGTRIEPWTPPCGFKSVSLLQDLYQQSTNLTSLPAIDQKTPSALYNGMVHAHIPFAIRGAIWYQGESNHGEGLLYVDKSKALIDGWRKLWGHGFPFYFVQIAPFQYGDENPSTLPEFWEAQAEIVKTIPNTGMAVINDCATLDNIHPPDKKDPGIRLALLAEAKTYGMDVTCTGPVFQTLEKQDGKLAVVFNSAKGLTTRDGKAPDWFEIAGADRAFKPAATGIKGNSVILESPEVSDPQFMRFAWSKLAEPNLVNGAGLPAAAFRASVVE